MSGQEQLSPEERVDKLEAAVMNLAAWQPVASDIISGNRDLIVQLGARIEFLETALNQLTLNLATGNTAVAAGPGMVTAREAEAGKGVAKEAAGTSEILLSIYFHDNHQIFSGERDCGSPGPVSRHRNRHRHTKSDHHLPKFSISLEEAEAWAVQAGLSSGPASLPALLRQASLSWLGSLSHSSPTARLSAEGSV